MEEDEFGPELQYWYSFQTSFCRIVNNELLPTTMNIKLGIEIIEEEEMRNAITRLDHWKENFLSSAIAVSSQDAIGFEMLLDADSHPRMSNPLMITPGMPTDSRLMMIFQAKIEAIADGAFIISSIEGESDNAAGLTVTFMGDTEDELPAMENWLSGPSWFEEPWWRRNDISMIDIVASEEADLTVRPVWASTFHFLEEMEEAQRPATIITGNFEPRIHDPKE
jgi:hypothetical protein